MKVVFALGRLDVGGVEMRTRELLAELNARDIEMQFVVYSISGLRGALDDDYRRLGAEIVYGRPGLIGLWHFWRTLRMLNADVLHCNVSTASGYYALVARLACVPKVITHYRSMNDMRGGIFHGLKGRFGRWLSNRLSSNVIGVCSAVQDYAGPPATKWSTVYDGILIQAGIRVHGPGLRVGYLGRLSPEKNPVRAIAIIDAVRAHPTGGLARLRMAGTGPPDVEAAVCKEIRMRGLEGAVELLGNVVDPLGFLRSCDVLILPSFREGLPGAVLEALSVGTPVVATDLPGVKEIAGLVTGIRFLSLSQSDQAWADAVIDSLRLDAQVIIESFGRSPFLIERHADQMAELWGVKSRTAA